MFGDPSVDIKTDRTGSLKGPRGIPEAGLEAPSHQARIALGQDLADDKFDGPHVLEHVMEDTFHPVRTLDIVEGVAKPHIGRHMVFELVKALGRQGLEEFTVRLAGGTHGSIIRRVKAKNKRSGSNLKTFMIVANLRGKEISKRSVPRP